MAIQFLAALKMLLRNMKDKIYMARIFSIVVVAFIMTACQSTASSVPDIDETAVKNYTPIRFSGVKATPSERSKCEVVGGKYIQNVGIVGIDICHQDLPDAGRICRDSDDCLSQCMAVKSANVGKRATGQCSLYQTNHGCSSRIENGRVEPVLCVD